MRRPDSLRSLPERVPRGAWYVEVAPGKSLAFDERPTLRARFWLRLLLGWTFRPIVRPT